MKSVHTYDYNGLRLAKKFDYIQGVFIVFGRCLHTIIYTLKPVIVMLRVKKVLNSHNALKKYLKKYINQLTFFSQNHIISD